LDKKNAMLPKLFRRLALASAVLAFVVIVLGAWVRLSAAGLGCPDWPGCYGHLTAGEAAQNIEVISEAFPHRPFEYEKAVKEMVHRYFASTLGLLIVIMACVAIVNRHDPRQPLALPLALVGLVIFQGLLGMWTVTLLLKPLVVVLHLLGGLATFSLCAWLAMRGGADSRASESRSDVLSQSSHNPVRTLAVAALVVLVAQIALGGWTSSNYAALACPDFPTCQNSYWPEMDAREAFVLWRGLGIDYEGGVLDHPARVAIHFVHRLGAIAAAVVLGWLSFSMWRNGTTASVRNAGLFVGILLLVQLLVGPIMVMRALPLWLATAHNAVAALLLLAVVRANHVLRPPAAANSVRTVQ
jgi:cytochrome c oxidase assembly protein subunit 15